MRTSNVFILCLLIGCRTSVPEVEGAPKPAVTATSPKPMLGGTVYPTGPTGPCSGDTAGTYPNCEVAKAEQGLQTFPTAGTYGFGSYPGNLGTLYSVAGDSLTGLEASLYSTSYEIYSQENLSFVPVTAVSPIEAYYRGYGTTTVSGQTVTLPIGIESYGTCHIVLDVLGKQVTVAEGGTGSVGDGYLSRIHLAAVTLSNSSAARALGTPIVFSLLSDTSQTLNTVTFTYTTNPNYPTDPNPGLVNATATSNGNGGPAGSVDWVLTAKIKCVPES